MGRLDRAIFLYSKNPEFDQRYPRLASQRLGWAQPAPCRVLGALISAVSLVLATLSLRTTLSRRTGFIQAAWTAPKGRQTLVACPDENEQHAVRSVADDARSHRCACLHCRVRVAMSCPSDHRGSVQLPVLLVLHGGHSWYQTRLSPRRCCCRCVWGKQQSNISERQDQKRIFFCPAQCPRSRSGTLSAFPL